MRIIKNYVQEFCSRIISRFHADIKCLSIKKSCFCSSWSKYKKKTNWKVYTKKIESSFQHAIKHLNLQNNSKIFHVWTYNIFFEKKSEFSLDYFNLTKSFKRDYVNELHSILIQRLCFWEKEKKTEKKFFP